MQRKRVLLTGVLSMIWLMLSVTALQANPNDSPTTPQTLTDNSGIAVAQAGTGQWQVMPSNNQPTARHENAFVQLGGRFYLLGGRGNRQVQMFNPASGNWTSLGLPPLEMNHFQAVVLDNLIYVVGAYTNNFPTEQNIPNIYIFDPATNLWITGPAIPSARRRGSAGVAVRNGRIYMVGGVDGGHGAQATARNYFDEFNPLTNTWTTLPNAPRPRDHFHAAIAGNSLYAVGGRDTGQANFFATVIAEVDVYNFASGTWSTLPASSNLPTPRGGSMTAVLGNEVIVIGGEGGGIAYDNTEALDITTNTWRSLDDLIQSRHGTQIATCNDVLYTVAGSGDQGGSPELTNPETFTFAGSPAPCPQTAVTPGNASLPGSIDFGSVAVGSSATQNVTLSNTGGNQGLIIRDIDANGADFSFNFPNTLPIIIPPGGSVTISVTFTPQSPGGKSGDLDVTHSTLSNSAITTLTGVGTTANTPPDANTDTATTDQGVAVLIDVLANDNAGTDPIDPTSVVVTGGPADGAVTVNPASGVVTYTPDPGFNGADAFTYTVEDTSGRVSNTATVNITVNAPVPVAPVAVDDGAGTLVDNAVIVDVLANDTAGTDPIDPATVTVTGGPNDGATTVDPATGAVTYTPDPGFTGTDTFTYTVADTSGRVSNTATVTLTVSTTPPTVTPVPTAAPTTSAPSGAAPTTVAAAQPGIQAGDPFITKRANPPFALPGERVTFIFTITNPNDIAVSNVSAVDPLPGEVAIISATADSGTVSVQGQSVIFSQSQMAPRQTVTVTIETRVRADVGLPFIITNEACASAAGSATQCAQATVSSVSALPTTGESPWARSRLFMLAVASIFVGLMAGWTYEMLRGDRV